MALSLETREKQYRAYIAEHINNVWNTYKFYEPVWKEILTEDELEELEAEVRAHDASKWSKEEFYPYMDRFFPEIPVPEGVKPPSNPEFDRAWLHHIHNNPHHPEYHVLYEEKNNKIIKTVFDMPKIDVIHMLCDWGAMSIYCHDTLWNYWESKGKDKVMSSSTKELTNKIVYMMKDYVDDHVSKL